MPNHQHVFHLAALESLDFKLQILMRHFSPNLLVQHGSVDSWLSRPSCGYFGFKSTTKKIIIVNITKKLTIWLYIVHMVYSEVLHMILEFITYTVHFTVHFMTKISQTTGSSRFFRQALEYRHRTVRLLRRHVDVVVMEGRHHVATWKKKRGYSEVQKNWMTQNCVVAWFLMFFHDVWWLFMIFHD